MTSSIRLTASLVLFTALLSSSAFSDGFLKTSGTAIVNDKGQEVILRGMGLGGWHVQEGYMFSMPSGTMNAAWQIRNRIVEVVGTANADSFYNAFTANFVTRRDIERLAQLGFNSVRMPMHYLRFFSTSSADGWNEKGFVEMDSLLRWCGDNKMYLILDLHAAPGGQSKDNISDYNPAYPSLWESEANKQLTVDLWKKLAQRYANEPWIGGYDLLNETHWTLGTNVLRDMMVRITTAIRTVDTKHIVFIEGNDYANNFAGLTPPSWDNNIVYSFHKYWNVNDLASISWVLAIRSTYNVPLWMGESGENSNAWFTDAIRLLENNKIGWSWWTLKKFNTTVGPFSISSTPEYQTLLNYWNGSGAKPSVAVAMNGLMGMAEKLKLDNCTYHPDVIDAMLRAPFDNTPKPFAANALPGRLYAVNYDFGNNNVAYKDADYQATTQGGATNQGYQYRNDGVDIEKCTDLPTNGYDVGWTAANEFLNFTVNVAQTRKYLVTLRTAVNDANSMVGLIWDNGTPVQKILTQTGGWTTWTTQNLGFVDLTAGTHSLKFFMYTGGFNLNYIDIVDAGPTSVAEQPAVPTDFSLSQNFPNPFNPSTRITFSVKSTGPVTLTVTDVLGREAAVLVNERLEAGTYERTFSAGPTLMSGVYFCTLKSGGQTSTRPMLLMK
jgi:aryl-phospho-beta-D-glucosidase BglC (GH1 family)